MEYLFNALQIDDSKVVNLSNRKDGDPDVLWRVDHYCDDQLIISPHLIVERTDKCVRLYNGKLVNFNWKKQWAYKTQKEALLGFYYRKIKQIKILEENTHISKQDLQIITDHLKEEGVEL